MIRRLTYVLLTLALIFSVAPTFVVSQAHAQDGSPVPVEPAPGTEIPVVPQADDPTATTFTGNTPEGYFTGAPIYPRADVYFSYYRIVTGGNTTVSDGGVGFVAAGYRADNAKVITIETTAVQEGNFNLCVIFDTGAFANPASVDLFMYNGSTWDVLAAFREGSTVCGYTSSFGVFAVAEPGTTPSATATDVPPTETATASSTPTDVPPTDTATATDVPPSETATASPTATDIPPTVTATASPTPTLVPPSASATATVVPPTATASPSSSPTAIPSTATPIPSPTATLVPPSATATASFTPTAIPSTQTATASSTATAIPPSSTAIPTSTATPIPPSWTATETTIPSATFTTTPVIPTGTSILSATPTATSSPSATSTSTSTSSPTQSATVAPNPVQYALPNVYVTYAQIPASGTTTGTVLSSGDVPVLPAAYVPGSAWFFSVSSTVAQTGNKRLCVIFETASYTDPQRVLLLQRNGGSWTEIQGQVFESPPTEQGTRCGYISSFGDFALVERSVATAAPTWTPSHTPTATRTPSSTPTWPATHTSTATSTPTVTTTPTSSSTPSHTVSPTPSVSSIATQTASPSSTPSTTLTPSPTVTIMPGSYPVGTALRATTRVNVRTDPGTTAPILGAVSSGSIVTVTGPSTKAGSHTWVPVMTSFGSGWIAGAYLTPISTTTPTRTPAPATITRTPGIATSTRTATIPTGGFAPGDSVRTTARVNLRSGPSTSAGILRVIPSKTTGTVTGPGVTSGGVTFYPISISGYPTGYVAGSYLQRVTVSASPTRTPSPTVAGVTIRYTTANVNLRSGPGTNYRRIATILEGTQVNLTGAPRRINGTDWYPVVINGVGSGWISGAFLARTYEPV